MWAQDAAAMYGYAGSSAAAGTLSPFTPPQQSTNPAGLAAQGAVIAQTTGAGAVTNIQAALTQLISTVPTALQGLASPLSSTATSLLTPALSVGSSSTWIASSALFDSSQVVTLSSSGSAAAAPLAGGLGSTVLTSSSGGIANFGGGGMGAAVSASTGRAALVGSLSVPPTWTGAAPTASAGRVAALADTSQGAAPPAGQHEPGMLGGLPLAGPAGRTIPAALPDRRFLERPAMVPPWSTV
jgi:PPE-repeat protein